MEEENRWNHLRYHFLNCSNLLHESMERKTPSRFLQRFEFRSGNLRTSPYHGRDRLVQTIKFQNWQQSSRQSSLCKLAVQASNSAGYSSSFRFDLKTCFGLQHYHSLKNPCYVSLSDCLFSDISLFFFYLVDSVRFLLNSTGIVWCFFSQYNNLQSWTVVLSASLRFIFAMEYFNPSYFAPINVFLL